MATKARSAEPNAARLTAADTIYCARTLELASLVLVLSAALQGGARLQLGLAGTDDGAAIWQEILNSGATVVVVDDELSRALADAPLPPLHPVRFVLGDLLSSESAQVLVDRLGVRTRYRPLASTAR